MPGRTGFLAPFAQELEAHQPDEQEGQVRRHVPEMGNPEEGALVGEAVVGVGLHNRREAEEKDGQQAGKNQDDRQRRTGGCG